MTPTVSNGKQITAILKLQPYLYGTRNTASQLNLSSKKDFCIIAVYIHTNFKVKLYLHAPSVQSCVPLNSE